MPQEFHGKTGSVASKSFCIVVSTYHSSITGKLLEGAIQTLTRNQVEEANISVMWVPGAWEIPSATQTALDSKKFDAVLRVYPEPRYNEILRPDHRFV